MPIESTVATAADLNAAWPLDEDGAKFGAVHIRNLKKVAQDTAGKKVPKTLSGDTSNSEGSDGHTHAISTSSSVESTETSVLANSAAVKTAFDKGVEGLNKGVEALNRANEAYDKGVEGLNRANQAYARGNEAFDKGVEGLNRASTQVGGGTVSGIYYNSAIIELGGDFGTGFGSRVVVTRVGDTVTISGYQNSLTLTSPKATPVSAASLPIWACGQPRFFTNVYAIDGTITQDATSMMVQISTEARTLSCHIRSSSGGGVSVNAVGCPTITYTNVF